MKIVSRKLKRGLVVFQVENLDDLWTLYNLISPGDHLDGKTSRRVVHKDSDDSKGERKLIYLKIEVEDIEFHEFSNRLRVKGKIIEGPEDIVTLNSYHTFNVEEGSKIGLIKEEWTPLNKKILSDAEKGHASSKVLVLLLDSESAMFGEIGDYYQKTSVDVTSHIPGKRYGDVKDSKNAKTAYFGELFKNLKLMLEKSQYAKILIGGPGFMKEQFLEHCARQEPDLKPLLVMEATSSATVSGMHELVRKEAIQKHLKDSRIVEETNLVDEFMARLGKDSGDFAYGLDEIDKVADLGAVEHLLITDEMMRRVNVDKDRAILQLLRKVENGRGNIMIVSTLHDAGSKVKGFGGMIALLRFNTSYASTS